MFVVNINKTKFKWNFYNSLFDYGPLFFVAILFLCLIISCNKITKEKNYPFTNFNIRDMIIGDIIIFLIKNVQNYTFLVGLVILSTVYPAGKDRPPPPPAEVRHKGKALWIIFVITSLYFSLLHVYLIICLCCLLNFFPFRFKIN